MNDLKSDVIVVGGGLAGLTTAVYLARAGLSVTVVEKARALGGRASTQVKDGFFYNQGPHALYIEGAGRAILKELGVSFQGKKPVTVKKSFGVLNGRLHLLPGDVRSFFQTDLLNGRGKLALGKFFLQLFRTKPQDVANESAGSWIARHVSHPNLRKMVEMLGRVSTYANAPDVFSAGVLVQQLQFALGKNVLYLDGGWQTLVSGLEEAAVSAGVVFKMGERVTAVTELPDHAQITLADGEILMARQVVMATNPAHVAELLPKHQQVQQWRETAVPIKASIFDVALKRLPKPDHLLAFDLELPLYLSTHSAFAQLTPEQGDLVHVMKYLAPNEDGASSRAELESFLDLVQPGWREEAIHTRFLPEMTVTHWLATVENDGLNGRPPLQIPGQTRLFLAGDWVGSEGWLADAAFASGKAVAEKIVASKQYSVNSFQYPVNAE